MVYAGDTVVGVRADAADSSRKLSLRTAKPDCVGSMSRPSAPALRYLEAYVHENRIGVLVEFALESEFTMRSDAFGELARQVAMQIAATDPSSLEALLEQAWLRAPERSVATHIGQVGAVLQERLEIARFIRWG